MSVYGKGCVVQSFVDFSYHRTCYDVCIIFSELVTILNKEVTVDEINAAMKAASNESFGYNEDQIVSSDIVGISNSSLFDATQTEVTSADGAQLVKSVSWYDNEMSYTSNLVRTLAYFAKIAK